MSFHVAIDPEWQPYVSVNVGDASAEWNNLSGKGYARYTPTTAKRLSDAPVAPAATNTLPAGATYALISVTTNPIRCRFDGTNPTASEGLLLDVGTHKFTNRTVLEQFRFIDSA